MTIEPTASVPAVSKPMTIYDLRKRILDECDVLSNIISVANGKLPEAWKTITTDGDEDERRLSLGDIVKANYVLLNRILPELKSIEFVDTNENNVTSVQSREKFFNAITSRLDAAHKAALPDGDTIS